MLNRVSRYDAAGLERVRRRARSWHRWAGGARLRPAYFLTTRVGVFQTQGQSADQSYVEYLASTSFPPGQRERKRILNRGRGGRVASGRVTARYSRRGTPLIGVANAGKVLGPDVSFPNEDNIGLHLGNKLRDMVTAAAGFS